MKFYVVICLIIIVLPVFSQNNTLQIQINNQPDNLIYLGSVKGDGFTILDSAFAKEKTVKFSLRKDLNPGIYRVVFGQTLYAKVMQAPHQQLDLIFNREDIDLKTDFRAPEDSLKIIKSAENKVWYSFSRTEKEIQKKLMQLELELDNCEILRTTQKRDDSETIKRCNRIITEYNQLQKRKENLINQVASGNSGLFVSKLVKINREPFRDGNLSKNERNKIFKTRFFDGLDFSDESLINSQVYTTLAYKYLFSYAQKGLSRTQQEEEFKKAADIILFKANQNEKVYEQVMDYLVEGFEKLDLVNIILYIAGKYSGTTCQTDEKTTLERKLGFYNMKPGSQVPDFTLNNTQGKPITLSSVAKSRTMLIFWASWCPHCSEILPEAEKLTDRFPDIRVVSVSLDTNRLDWIKKAGELQLNSWNNLSDLKGWDGETASMYNVYATPTFFLIDKNLRLIAKPFDMVDLQKILER